MIHLNSSDNVLQGRFTLHTFLSKFQPVSQNNVNTRFSLLTIFVSVFKNKPFFVRVKNPCHVIILFVTASVLYTSSVYTSRITVLLTTPT